MQGSNSILISYRQQELHNEYFHQKIIVVQFYRLYLYDGIMKQPEPISHRIQTTRCSVRIARNPLQDFYFQRTNIGVWFSDTWSTLVSGWYPIQFPAHLFNIPFTLVFISFRC
jgi:hypothetical protein